MRGERVGLARAYELRCEIEVVVVEEHRGVRIALELRDRRVGKSLVHR